MKHHWSLIANAAQARVFQHETGLPPVLIQTFAHPASRSKISDLADDRVGHESADNSYGGASYAPRTDAKRKEHERFARELADYLESQAQQRRYESVTIYAGSPFLGEVKALLGSATQRLLAGTHDIDLSAVGPAELERRIALVTAQPAG